ncbi:MAG: hypothetical protein GEU77_11385 [Deltaproteobacteria bacterium]|nr:hypothetical protein [Deltaproteobacteria bacterium]
MKTVGIAAAGQSRSCPHCKATILKSSVSCPLCRHVLRFGSTGAEEHSNRVPCPLSVEGTINHPGAGEAVEYFILMEVRDEAGKIISRQSLGVGALHQAEKRIFTLRVEMSSASAPS